MKKITFKILIITSVLLGTLGSCNKWLEVQPIGQSTAETVFSTYKGFNDALSGCYYILKDRQLYGENLTMTYLDNMAHIWRPPTETDNALIFQLYNFDYENQNVIEAIKPLFNKQYNVIAQANLVIENYHSNGHVIPNEKNRSTIGGEAYGLRAFCHFDVLRLYGQLPHNGSINVRLPYAEKVHRLELPKYYDYDQFVAKIESDLNTAVSLLKDNDPVFEYTFTDLNNINMLDDENMLFRQYRFNYWAVRALQARFYLYIGNKPKAYEIAKEIIDAQGPTGAKVVSLSTSTDIKADNFASPSECLFLLHAYNIHTYSPQIMGYGSDGVGASSMSLVNLSQVVSLFPEAGDVRYASLWERTMTSSTSTNILPVIKKYYYRREDGGASASTNRNSVIPMIRLSEIYLIAIECTQNLAEANTLWVEYQRSKDIGLASGTLVFDDLSKVIPVVQDEYFKEFIGEGQMFYVYKRMGATAMKWTEGTIEEKNYIMPLPSTEFEVN